MPISISDVTSGVATVDGVVTGDGAFDDLMEAVNSQLKNQFELGRITGTDYATVYLGAMQGAIQSAVQFALTKEKTNADTTLVNNQSAEILSATTRQDAQSTAQVALINNQTTTELKKALDVESTTTVRNTQSTEDSALKTAQTTLATNQSATELKQALDVVATTTLKTSQEAEVIAATTRQDSESTAKISLMADQEATEVKKALDTVAATTLKNNQSNQIESETINSKLQTRAELFIAEQKLITERVGNGEAVNEYIWEIEYNEDVDKTYTLMTIQNFTENDVTARLNFDPHVAGYTVKTVTLNQVTALHEKGDSLVGAQIDKALQEVDVLKQKAITEYAQTQQTTKLAPADGSTIGRQATLFEQQANGFKWNAQNAHNTNLVTIDKMRMNVSGFVSSDPDADTEEGYTFSITDPTSTA